MTNRWNKWNEWLVERSQNTRDALINIRRAFVLVWNSHPPSAMAMLGCTLVGAFLPAGQAWVGKLIVDAVVNAINNHVGAELGLQAVLPLLVAEFVLLVAQSVNNQARTFAEHILHARMNLAINTRIIRKALELDLTYFENPEYYDRLQNARREADWRGLQIANGSFFLLQNVLTLLSFGALLLRFSPLLALILFLATIPAFIAQSRYAELSFRVLSWRAPEARQLSYLEYLLTDYDAAKEIKLFGLGAPLLGRYANLFWKFIHPYSNTPGSNKKTARSERFFITRRQHSIQLLANDLKNSDSPSVHFCRGNVIDAIQFLVVSLNPNIKAWQSFEDGLIIIFPPGRECRAPPHTVWFLSAFAQCCRCSFLAV